MAMRTAPRSVKISSYSSATSLVFFLDEDTNKFGDAVLQRSHLFIDEALTGPNDLKLDPRGDGKNLDFKSMQIIEPCV